MPLKVYQQKRNFNITSEPRGYKRSTLSQKKSAHTNTSHHLYIIQKHAASHLHYDFRLELNGVLLSWAVPKGPSLDPTVKRLAMHVEDHPLEYGNFEGTIPKGQYGGGTVMLWDKGEWIPDEKNPVSAYKKGKLSFTIKAKKLNGHWKIFRINNNDKTWLLIKVKDKFAKSEKKHSITQEQPNSVLTHHSLNEIKEKSVSIWSKKGLTQKSAIDQLLIHLPKQAFPSLINVQLATLVDQPPVGKNWIHEIKLDGYRFLAFKQGKKVKLVTRNHNDWSAKFDSILNEIRNLPVENVVLDGEIITLDDKQHSNFQLLQNSIKEGKINFFYYLFDIIYYNHFDLTQLPLIKRKIILEQVLSSQKHELLRYSDHITGSGKSILKKSCKIGLEGIVSKEANSFYSQKRDSSWLKTKCIKRQEFIIGGFKKSERRAHFRSLMLGTFNKNGKLNYHGHVGTGFTQESLATINKLLSKNKTSLSPFDKNPPQSKRAFWVKPVIIAEIEFTEWTTGGTLRHPSFKGIRSDKSPKHIIKEVEVPVRTINVTHPDKILYSEDNITKGQIAEYFHTVQSWILPFIINRPLSIVRCPKDYTKCFFQKHIVNQKPDGLYDVKIKEKIGSNNYIYLTDAKGLMALPQLGVLEIHPWNCKINNIEHPDMIIFDLDPAPEVSWRKVVQAAFEIKAILNAMKLSCFVKTTGGKGLHVVVPIKPENNWDDIKNFSHTLVNYLVAKHPKDYINIMTKSKRKNKIFIDYLRNQRGATSIAPYSTRCRLHAPVSTPIEWDELTNNFKDTFFTIKTVTTRLQHLKNDPWQDILTLKQKLNLKKL